MAPTIDQLRARLGVAAGPTQGQGLALGPSGQIPAALVSRVTKNGVFVGHRHGLNFITGSGVTVTVADNPALDRVDVTITAP